MKKEWVCWTLSIEDIEEVCKELGVDFKKLSEDNIEDIAYKFKKGFEFGNEDWDLILEDAINNSLGRKYDKKKSWYRLRQQWI